MGISGNIAHLFLLKSRLDWFSNVQILCHSRYDQCSLLLRPVISRFFLSIFFQKFLETCVLHLLWVTEAEMYHRQILCNSNKPEMGKDSTHGLARPRACPHFRRPQIRLFHLLFQQIPSFRQQQSLILPTLFYDKYYDPIAGDTTLKKPKYSYFISL